MTKPLVLITGGAGFLGINLCRFLLARGYAVRSLDIAPFNYPKRATVDVMLGDIRDSAVVAQAMRGVRLAILRQRPTISTIPSRDIPPIGRRVRAVPAANPVFGRGRSCDSYGTMSPAPRRRRTNTHCLQ